MKFLLQMMDYVIFHFLWACHVINNWIISTIKGNGDIKEEKSMESTAGENGKRHFIHLYTTSGVNGRPVCYMDVYEIFSLKEEKMLRHATSKGYPNKTYHRYNRSKSSDIHDKSESWLEYSTLAI